MSRAFICLAESLGISAQRMYLYGRVSHVVAVAELEGGKPLLIDCQNPPMIDQPQSLDAVLLRPEFSDYSTLNLRRIGLGRVVSRLKVQIGPFTYLLENPHAFKAVGCLLFLTALWAGTGARYFLRWCLHRRGWVHRSSIEAAAKLSKPTPPRSRRI